MKRFWASLMIAVFCILPLTAVGQDVSEGPVINSEWIIPSEHPPTSNILFLIDGSGSMSGDKVNAAIDFALSIAGAPVDDLQIAVVTFGSHVRRWEGTEDIDPRTGQPMSREGWAVMPSADNLGAARAWLSENLDMGSTHLRPGLIHSFASCSGGEDPLSLYSQNVESLTIIILTDGAFSDSMEVSIDGAGILDVLAGEQQNRINAELDEAIIGVIGINVNNDRSDANMRRLAGLLGYLSLTFSKE
jgi:hypothetical protein